MSQGTTILRETTGLCPECLEPVPGRYINEDGSVYLRRTCSDHGVSTRQVWASQEHWTWTDQYGPDNISSDENTLSVEKDHTCLSVIEITEDCNLECSYCFASSGPSGKQRSAAEIIRLLETVKNEAGTRPIQFSGGEPTVHDELPALVAHAHGMGFEHIEVNTNGITLANQPGYAEKLCDAGVTAIYLQFDGLTSETYIDIREADLLQVKHDAIEACRRADLPVILVPTIVPGVNKHEMGDIMNFALENLDIVKSVNFQPVSHFGRFEKNDGRYSLDEAARDISTQLPAVEPRDFMPVPCCSAYCQTASAVMRSPSGQITPLTGLLDLEYWGSVTELIKEEDWMEILAGTQNGKETMELARDCCGIDAPVGCGILPVSFTGFMDADAADLDRLDNCCIAVPTPDGEMVPFCAYNMTTDDGEYALRDRHEWSGKSRVSTGQSATTNENSIDPDDRSNEKQ